MTTTKDKLEFVHAMARHTKATVRQCEALMRYAATLQRLAEDECNVSVDESGQQKREAKFERIRKRVSDLCYEIDSGQDTPYGPGRVKVRPVFSGDPSGAVLKIRVPDGFTDDMGREGICVPS